MTEDFNPFAAPQAVDSPSPHEAWATDHPQALRRVKTGLTCVYFGICGILLAALSMPFLGMMVFAQGPGVAPAGFAWFGAAIAGVMIALTLLILVGELLCTAVPSESGGKRLAIAAIVLQVAYILVCIVAKALEETEVDFAAASALLVGTLIWVASLVCFVLFMRRLALYIRRKDLVGRATRVLIVGGVASLLLIGGGAFLFQQIPGLPDDVPPSSVAGLAVGIGGFLAFVTFIMYANMVTYLRKAIMA